MARKGRNARATPSTRPEDDREDLAEIERDLAETGRAPLVPRELARERMAEVGKMVARLRRRRDWTQEGLARRSGLTPETIGRIERMAIPNARGASAEYVASLDSIIALARVFDVPLDVILGMPTPREALYDDLARWKRAALNSIAAGRKPGSDPRPEYRLPHELVRRMLALLKRHNVGLGTDDSQEE